MTNIAEQLAARYHNQDLTPQAMPEGEGNSYEAREAALLDSVRSLLGEGIPFIVGADVDKNLCTYQSVSGEIPGLDPRGVVIDENARIALAAMHENGIPIVISTSRGAAEVSQYLRIPGITIIGSQGLEVRRVDDVNYNEGKSQIDPQFIPYQQQINGIMQDVYKQFAVEVLGIEAESVELPTEPVFELPTPGGGKVVVQLKGQSTEFPMGIAMALNVNQPIAGTPEEYVARQGEIAQIQQGYLTKFREIFNEAWTVRFPNDSQEALRKIISVRTRQESILYNGEQISTLDLEIRPGMESGKGYAQLQLMRLDGDPKRARNFEGVPSAPFTYFSGDSVELESPDPEVVNERHVNDRWRGGQDWSPMHVGHLVYAVTRRTSKGRGGVIGIQTLRTGKPTQEIPNVDIIVDGPAGLGRLLMKMAEVVQKYRQQEKK